MQDKVYARKKKMFEHRSRHGVTNLIYDIYFGFWRLMAKIIDLELFETGWNQTTA